MSFSTKKPKSFVGKEGTPYSGLLLWNGHIWTAYALEYGLVGAGSTQRQARHSLDAAIEDCDCVLEYLYSNSADAETSGLWQIYFDAKLRALWRGIYQKTVFVVLLFYGLFWLVF